LVRKAASLALRCSINKSTGWCSDIPSGDETRSAAGFQELPWQSTGVATQSLRGWHARR
jgi:hypothetical protein